MLIREELARDATLIDEVHRSAFSGSQVEQGIVRALRERGRLVISLVAEVDGQVVGHIAMSPVSISDGTANWYGLGPVAVLPAHQRRGIGTRLVREALERLRTLGARGCVVVGEPGFYERFGFKADAALVFPGVPAEYFQALRFAGAAPRGEVTYDEAFAAA